MAHFAGEHDAQMPPALGPQQSAYLRLSVPIDLPDSYAPRWDPGGRAEAAQLTLANQQTQHAPACCTGGHAVVPYEQ